VLHTTESRRVAALLLCGVLCAMGAACGSRPGSGPDADSYRSERDDLAKSPEHDCQRCFFLQAFRLMVPIPDRYTLVGASSLKNGCIGFVSPREPLLGRLGFAESVNRFSGIIRYCGRDILDVDAARQSGQRAATFSETDGPASITVWKAEEIGSKFTLAYIRTADEGLWITDMDPLLWRVMWNSAKRSALPGDVRFNVRH
jgi:hypothetical protein